MSESIINWLEHHKDANWDSYGEGATKEEIARTMVDFDFHLPSDYEEILRLSKGFSVEGEHERIYLEELIEATSLNEEPDNMLYIPGMFIIGGDGGGNFYYYDPKNILGRGAFAVYHVGMGSISYKNSVYVGSSLSDTIKKIVEGVSYSDLPYLMDEGEVPEVPRMPPSPVINTMEELLKHLPSTIHHPIHGKGELEIKESTKKDGSLHVSGGYNMEDDMILYYTFGGDHQGLYNAMAPYLFIKGLLNHHSS